VAARAAPAAASTVRRVSNVRFNVLSSKSVDCPGGRRECSEPRRPIVNDADYYILRAQNSQRWADDDRAVDAKLASFRKKNHGKPPNLVYVLVDDMGFGHGPNAIARSAVACSRSLDDNAAIVIYTGTGGTARLISDYRPKVPILAYTPNPQTYQSLSLYWGVIPRLLEVPQDREGHVFDELDRAVQRDGFVARGATVVMVMGFPIQARTSVNLIKLHKISEALPPGSSRDS